MTQRRGARSALRDFLQSEASGGIFLMAAAALAMIVANSVFRDGYHHLLHTETGPVLAAKLGPMTPHLWINDGLMAVFFLLVGLEIKREFVDGRLSSWKQRRLPVIAAAAGMIVPAGIYLLFASGDATLWRGWAIPAATDIAFAIGVLALLGSRAPTSLKLFLTTVAIVDDMGAVAIIAVAYTASITGMAVIAAGLVLGAMYAMNRLGVRALWPYLIGFMLLWYAVLLSGVHATIAGVLAAMTIPIVKTPGAPDSEESPLHRLEHALHPWVAYLIVPLFGFANAGVTLEGMGLEHILAPLPLGIAAGLFFGKQIGIFGSIWISVKLGIASKLRGATWLQIYGVAMLCGIGFTMSLFIGALAFPENPLLIEEAKIGVLLGSVASALVGFLVLRFVPQHASQAREELAQASEIDRDGDVHTIEDQGAASLR
ncbi:Na+/H+ antiporter NhaA [Sphingomonas cavernae]|uniref:Na(+)/H(+) antiporter NhaA n=1 Tax=Sphingomonas cavernae TaxID=2320861 RepID=A0A418W8B4_9SPHN|nr:Na+/H+ antiporter NhaA [Sphingomonas cavernae]RJF86234.1 Na+/H+ antiporter NhaA [Sphingomonas cavernae]